MKDKYESNELGANGPDEFEQAEGERLDTKEGKAQQRS